MKRGSKTQPARLRFYERPGRGYSRERANRIELWFLMLEESLYPEREPALRECQLTVHDGVLRPHNADLDR